ncbi:MAG: alpha/beta fold hydrolase [Myxococcota bacterium]
MASILFLHGLEGSPTGRKANWLRQHYDAVAPALDTQTFEQAVADGAKALEAFRPALVIGSSYGGAVLLELACSGRWAGPSIFLAQAGKKLLPYDRLPPGHQAVFIHGTLDELIPWQESAELVEATGPSARLVLVEDEHRLNSVLGSVLAEAIHSLLPE